MKLFTSAAALEHLGADYRFSTFLVGSRAASATACCAAI
jgi:D-alanyl-D-alanine carboxypeptidase